MNFPNADREARSSFLQLPPPSLPSIWIAPVDPIHFALSALSMLSAHRFGEHFVSLRLEMHIVWPADFFLHGQHDGV